MVSPVQQFLSTLESAAQLRKGGNIIKASSVKLIWGICVVRGFLVTCNNVAITGGQLVAGLVCGALSSVDQGWRWRLVTFYFS